jgi:hypothetical protein
MLVDLANLGWEFVIVVIINVAAGWPVICCCFDA